MHCIYDFAKQTMKVDARKNENNFEQFQKLIITLKYAPWQPTLLPASENTATFTDMRLCNACDKKS